MGKKENKSRLKRNVLDFTKNFLIVSIIFAGSTITVSGFWSNDSISNSIFENTMFVVSEQEISGIIENTELPEVKNIQNQSIDQNLKTNTASPETASSDSGTGNTDARDNDGSDEGGGEQSTAGPRISYTTYIIYDINEIPNESQFLRDIGAYAEGYSVSSNYNSINKHNVGVYNITLSATNENGTSTVSVKVSITDDNTEIFYGN